MSYNLLMWIYKNKELKEEDIPAQAIGFIYIIKSNSEKMYVGKKLLTKAAYKTVNGKKKKIRKESDWQDYWSSSDYVKEAIAMEGIENYTREIICFCLSLAVLNYSEQKIQFACSVLEDMNWLNGNINAKIFKGNVYKKIPKEINNFILSCTSSQ